MSIYAGRSIAADDDYKPSFKLDYNRYNTTINKLSLMTIEGINIYSVCDKRYFITCQYGKYSGYYRTKDCFFRMMK